MSSPARIALVSGVLVAFVVAFLVFRGGDDSDEPATPDATAQATATPAAENAQPTATPRPKPQFTTIRAVGLKPVGGVKEIAIKKGGTIRLKVRSDQVDEAHLHGYDVSKPVGPGKTATYQVPAKLEGVFELELENAAVPLAEITVNP